MIELRSLRYLLAVAEEGHFTRAAARCFVSQPALSQQIRKLEEALGEVLIDRSVTPVRLTAAGEVVAAHARRVLAELEAMQVALDELQGLQRGSLMVGAVQTVQAYLIPYAVATFTRMYPGIRLQVLELPADEVEAGVLEGRFHLGLSFVPPGSDGLETVPLFEEELVLVVPSDHALAAQRVASLDMLTQIPLALLPATYCTRRLWDRWARAMGVRPKVMLEINAIEGLLHLVRKLRVATILPALTLRLETACGLRAVRLPAPPPRRTVGIVRRRGAYVSRAAQAFEEVLQAWRAKNWNGRAAAA
ncbi:transcriptional regulator CynR [Rhodothermus profundi]|uniref:LysR family transcriptional regulator, cyn operon transcriptional activator n=1 Tax=Rhodothermus profundi TaxID=633813 RepID=A0A1M6Q6Y7_9BACT|nr:transcriptional regulator CynR [Rhodothermus profundi]SHK16012.1 LysR family transcriptional regulator, cyn operon transcriptional activator [Rhodothermus profundi]